MKVVITGAAGFLGSHLTDKFLAEGHEVVGVDNFCTGHRSNLEHLAGNKAFSFVEADVSDGLDVAGDIGGVLHFACPASPDDYKELPIETLRVGSEGTRHALELASRKNARFFIASTSEIYGDPSVHPQVESYWGNVNTIGPRSMYDEAKRFGEAMTMAYHRSRGVDTRIVRIFNTYGPRMQPRDGRVVCNFIVQALTGEAITLYGDGSRTRSFCYVADEIDGIYRLFQRGDHNPVNIGNPGEYTMRQLAEMIIELTGSKSAIELRPLPDDNDPQRRRPDITRAKALLDWEPHVQLREGLERTIAYFRTLVGTPRMGPRVPKR